MYETIENVSIFKIINTKLIEMLLSWKQMNKNDSDKNEISFDEMYLISNCWKIIFKENNDQRYS